MASCKDCPCDSASCRESLQEAIYYDKKQEIADSLGGSQIWRKSLQEAKISGIVYTLCFFHVCFLTLIKVFPILSTGCSGFFKRTIHKRRVYACKAAGSSKGKCTVDKTNRNHCRACRLQKCLQMNMKKEAVQHERGPRRKIYDKVERVNKSSKGHKETQNKTLENSTKSKSDTNISSVKPNSTELKTSSSLCTPVLSSSFLSYAINNCEFCGPGSSEQIMSTMSWIQNQPAFKVLPHVDKGLLMSSSWRLLHLMDKLYLHTALRRPGTYAAQMQCCCLPDSCPLRMADVGQIMQLFWCLMLDVIELACLKMIVLFNSDAVHAVSRPMVARLQTETHLLLLEHISCYHPREVTRYGSLLMLINILKTMCVKSTIVS